MDKSRARTALTGVLIATSTFSGCADTLASDRISDRVSPAPERPWKAPPEATQLQNRSQPSPATPESLPAESAPQSLESLIDLALRQNPQTRVAWYQARAAAARLGSAKSAWYPTVNVGGSATFSQQAVLGGQYNIQQFTYGPSAALSWLIFDFGGRQAQIGEARYALYAADWTHNAALEDLVLQVEGSYYRYLSAKSLRTAAESSLEEARQNLAAAEQRKTGGLGTIAEELQARTAFSQAQLNLDSARGQEAIDRGALSAAVGLPANRKLEVGELPADVQLDRVQKNVDEVIAQAAAERPDLLAARARVEQAGEHVRNLKSQRLPSLSLNASANRAYYVPARYAAYGDNYSIGLGLSWPIFTGFRNTYNVQEARELEQVAKAQLAGVAEQITLQVWSSYYGLQTSSQRVRTAQELLKNATASEEVASARYKAGVGTILDLLAAQTALAQARAQEVQARADYLLSIAQLAHDTGVLLPTQSAATPQTGPQKELYTEEHR